MMHPSDQSPTLFHISDILSVVHDKAYSLPDRPALPSGEIPPYRDGAIEGAQELVQYMTGRLRDPIALVRALDICGTSLVRQFPWIRDVGSPDMEGKSREKQLDNLHAWIAGLEEKYGPYHEVTPLAHYQEMSMEEELKVQGDTMGDHTWADSIIKKTKYTQR